MDFFTRLVDGEIDLSDDDGGAATRLMTNVMAVRTRFFDDFFTRHAERRHPAGGDPGLRPRRPRLPAAVAGGHRRLRDRPAQGHRVQERDDGVDRRLPHRRAPRGQHRPARGLAGRIAPQRVRRHPADGVERRRTAGVPAARGAGPALRRHHRAVSARAAGWPPSTTPTRARASASAQRRSGSGGASTGST